MNRNYLYLVMFALEHFSKTSLCENFKMLLCVTVLMNRHTNTKRRVILTAGTIVFALVIMFIVLLTRKNNSGNTSNQGRISNVILLLEPYQDK